MTLAFYFLSCSCKYKCLNQGNVWSIKSESVIVTTEVKFEIGKQFEEVTADKRKVRSSSV